MNTELDPMDMPASDIDLSYPIAPAAIYPMVCSEAKVAPNKQNTGNNLVLKWKSTTEITSTKGDVIPAGQLVVQQYIGLTPTEKRTATNIAKDLSQLILGTRLPASTTPGQLRSEPTLLTGKEAAVKLKVQPETDEFPESNKVAMVVVSA